MSLNSLREEIRRRGGEVTAVAADVSDFEQVRAVADTAAERYGRLDTWVHLVGVGLYAAFDQTEPEEFERVVQVNLLGQLYGALAALPHLKREGRSFIGGHEGEKLHRADQAARRRIDGRRFRDGS